MEMNELDFSGRQVLVVGGSSGIGNGIARAFRASIAALPRQEDGDAIRFAVALHVGEVMYGNIGGGNRLDFTCIGPAVNLSARLEKVAAKLGEAVVASAEFAGHCPAQFRSLGEHAVAGFTAPQPVFGMAD